MIHPAFEALCEQWSAGSTSLLDLQTATTLSELLDEFGPKRVSVVIFPNASHALLVEQPCATADAIVNYMRRLR